MKRLLFFATLAAFVTGVFAALAPADGGSIRPHHK